MSFRILGLLGGGSKGVFSLGVLTEVEGILGSPLCKHFDLIAGTSTGAIIAALLGLGKTTKEITALYRSHVPTILGAPSSICRGSKLAEMGAEIFKGSKFDAFQTRVLIVTTNLTHSRPTLFKSYRGAWAGAATFEIGFGRTIAEAVAASCAAYPFFPSITLDLNGSNQELVDGGFCANDPSLFAIIDALTPLQQNLSDLRLLTVGTGRFASKQVGGFFGWLQKRKAMQVVETSLETTASTQEFCIRALFPTLSWCRIPSSSTDARTQANLLETNKATLDKMFECGRIAFRESETQFTTTFL